MQFLTEETLCVDIRGSLEFQLLFPEGGNTKASGEETCRTGKRFSLENRDVLHLPKEDRAGLFSVFPFPRDPGRWREVNLLRRLRLSVSRHVGGGFSGTSASSGIRGAK